MATREQEVSRFHSSSGPSNEKEKPGKVKVTADMSSVRNSGTEGPLFSALGHKGIPTLPSDTHVYTHTTRIEPVGARYEPRGEFGKRQATGKGKGVYSYGGAPNKKGENALGKAMNKVGEKSGYKNVGKQSGGGGKHV